MEHAPAKNKIIPLIKRQPTSGKKKSTLHLLTIKNIYICQSNLVGVAEANNLGETNFQSII